MLIFFPSGTDAPLYHLPYATAALILLNILVFILQNLFPGINESLILVHGSFNPIQWITSCVMHAGFFHLFGNMLTFAVFSWIIEGKVGWWRTILIYFAIGASANGFEQLIFLFLESSSPGSLGASGVVFGFFAIALLWAPENHIQITYAGLIFFYPLVGVFDVTISVFCFFMMAIEGFVVWFSFFEMSSALLHLMGAAPGFVIGYLMLKFRRVNCDGYDLFTIWQGKEGQATLTVAEEQAKKTQRQQAIEQVREQTQVGLKQIEHYLSLGQHEFALRRLQLLKKSNPRYVPPENTLIKMIRAFDASGSNRDQLVPLIDVYLKNYQRNKIPLTLMLARYYVVDKESPRKALSFLKRVDQKKMSPKESKLFKALAAKAQQLIADGSLELGD